MAWTAAQLPDLRGRTAVVTGGNSGIGFHTARELAAHGATVVLACRDVAAGRAAAGRMRSDDWAGPVAVTVAQLDLASMDSVREFAAQWSGRLDLLVNNAGVMAPPKRAMTGDGYERQFGVNHLGHYVLTGLLLPALVADEGARVVTVSSIAHFSGSADTVLDGNVGLPYSAQKSYGDSKLANLLFARELQRRLAEHGLPVTSTAAHPGVSATGLFSDREGQGANLAMRLLAPTFLRIFTQPASRGARASLYAATAAEPGSYTGPQRLGETRGQIGPAKLSTAAQDDRLARRLWHVSEDLTGFRYTWPTT